MRRRTFVGALIASLFGPRRRVTCATDVDRSVGGVTDQQWKDLLRKGFAPVHHVDRSVGGVTTQPAAPQNLEWTELARTEFSRNELGCVTVGDVAPQISIDGAPFVATRGQLSYDASCGVYSYLPHPDEVRGEWIALKHQSDGLVYTRFAQSAEFRRDQTSVSFARLDTRTIPQRERVILYPGRPRPTAAVRAALIGYQEKHT